MDRVRVLAPTLLAAAALLGQQGARFGPFITPEIGFRWIVVVVAVSFFLTPTRNERRLGVRDTMVAAGLGLCFAGRTLLRGPPALNKHL